MPNLAVGLRCVASRHRFTTQHIHLARNGLKVRWIYTVTNPTKMIERQALGNGTDYVFVGPDVGVTPNEVDLHPTVSVDKVRLP